MRTWVALVTALRCICGWASLMCEHVTSSRRVHTSRTLLPDGADTCWLRCGRRPIRPVARATCQEQLHATIRSARNDAIGDLLRMAVGPAVTLRVGAPVYVHCWCDDLVHASRYYEVPVWLGMRVGLWWPRRVRVGANVRQLGDSLSGIGSASSMSIIGISSSTRYARRQAQQRSFSFSPE